MICHYGCGREAKHRFKNGKWCCSICTIKCPAVKKRVWPEGRRKRQSEALKKFYRNNEGAREQRSKEQREYYRNESKEAKQKRISTIKKYYDNKENRLYVSKKMKEVFKSEEIRKKLSNNRRRTIEKTRKDYPTFSKEEEMRYNPKNPNEIQVHCRNPNCLNSKEKGGWFTPTSIQLSERIRHLEKDYGNKCSFLFCSDNCKYTSDDYYTNLKLTSTEMEKYWKYRNKVLRFTNLSIRKHSDKIENFELRGKKHGYHLDHMFSVVKGFRDNIDPKILGHHKNLRVLYSCKNLSKSGKCDITLEKLLEEILLEESHYDTV